MTQFATEDAEILHSVALLHWKLYKKVSMALSHLTAMSISVAKRSRPKLILIVVVIWLIKIRY